jgi:hypothetical protein
MSYIYINIGLMFGQIESESGIQQNACMEEITQSRDANIDLVDAQYQLYRRRYIL